MAYKVFISYSTRDLPYVEQVKNSLKGLADVKAYVAQHSLKPGQVISKEIQNAIDSCDLFLLLWSENAKGSEWVPQEIGIAKGKKKSILPVVLKSGINLPGFIQDLKYLNIQDKSADQLKWLRNHIAARAEDKAKSDNLVLLGLGVLVLIALAD